MTSNLVSIVLLNWNGADDTIECLESLSCLNYQNFNVFLVDNASEDNSVDDIEEYLASSNYSHVLVEKRNLDSFDDISDVNFILNDTNSGFAGGNNVALKYLIDNRCCDYVLLLNNDTIVKPDLLEVLLSKFTDDKDTGFVGINHYYYDDRSRLQTVGGGLVDFVHGEATAVLKNNTVDCYDFITGSCIFTSIDVLCKVGVICEDYFMYWEDVDWSVSLSRLGYKHRVATGTCIYHKEGASIKSLSRIYYHTRNRILFMKRNTTRSTYYKFLIYIILFVAKESASNIISNRDYSKTLLRGLTDALLG